MFRNFIFSAVNKTLSNDGNFLSAIGAERVLLEALI